MIDSKRDAAAFAFARKWLFRNLPRPRPRRHTAHGEPTRFLVFTKGANPTFDYYLESRIAATPAPVLVCDLEAGNGWRDVDPKDAFVVICRYLKLRHAIWIAMHRRVLNGVALLIDDDIPTIVVDAQGSLVYRLYLAVFGLIPLAVLNVALTEVWTSTGALRNAFAAEGIATRLLPPRPRSPDREPSTRLATAHPLRIAYHATDIHGPEHRFLVPIVEQVLRRHPDVEFEVLARNRNRRLWQEADIAPAQLRILPPLPWTEYVRHGRGEACDVLLVPLLAGQANSVRADTKRIDACRLGAAVVFSSCVVYERLASIEEAHVDNVATAWIAAIETILTDPARRQANALAVRRSVEEMAVERPLDLMEFCGSGRDREMHS